MTVRRSDNSDELDAALRDAQARRTIAGAPVSITAQRLAADAILARRRKSYPALVARRSMTQAFADASLAAAASIAAAMAWLDDNDALVRALLHQGDAVPAARLAKPFAPAVAFSDMRTVAAGYLASRERLTPKLIADGKMTPAQAEREIAEAAAILRTLTWFEKQKPGIDAALAALAGAAKEFPDAEIGGGRVEGRPAAGPASSGGRPGREGHHAG